MAISQRCINYFCGYRNGRAEFEIAIQLVLIKMVAHIYLDDINFIQYSLEMHSQMRLKNTLFMTPKHRVTSPMGYHRLPRS